MKLTELTRGALLLAALLTAGCTNPEKTKSGLAKADFETTVNGLRTSLYTLTNASGAEV